MVTGLLFIGISTVIGWTCFGHFRSLADDDVSLGTESAITIVIPARNEEASISLLLGDLALNSPAGTRVVVVDDHSTDHTAALATGGGAEVVAAPPLPAGWTGKNWACHTGTTAVTDGVVVFLDADVRVGPGALDQVVALQRRHGGAVSVQPFHAVRRPYEQLSALFNLVSVMGIGAGWPRPRAMFGPVICASVADYRAVGGHASVRSEVVEDLALAREFRSHDLPVTLRRGGRDLSFRMYPTGLTALVEGWTKNVATGAASAAPLLTAGVVLWICGLVQTCALMFRLAIGGGGDSPVAGATLVSALVTVAALGSTWLLLRRVGSFHPLAVVALPILLTFFMVIFVRSCWNVKVRRSVEWRGRRIAT